MMITGIGPYWHIHESLGVAKERGSLDLGVLKVYRKDNEKVPRKLEEQPPLVD